ncbi:MAG: NAD-specific glutamate dehydrogenase [Lentisphaerae bacterium ADurb.Bin082]|nr:MAG: NAD-specific glutamate dehydrogenase [Lentisphaerae bacterium ADurb.Bin082]
MLSKKAIISEQVERLEKAYQMLLDVMPENFLTTFADSVGKILPFLCNLDTSAGIRRIDFSGEVFFVYLLTDDCNPRVTSAMMAGQHLQSANVYKSAQPVKNGDKPFTLVIEHYVCGQERHDQSPVCLSNLQAEYSRLYGCGREAVIAEVYGRLNFGDVTDLDAAHLAQTIHWVLQAQGNDNVQAHIESWDSSSVRMTVAVSIPLGTDEIAREIMAIIYASGMEVRHCYFREVTVCKDVADFAHLPVLTARICLGSKQGEQIIEAQVTKLLDDIRLIGWVEFGDILHKTLVEHHHFSLAGANWVRAMCEFVHGQLAFVDRNAYNQADLTRFVALYPELASQLYKEFERRFAPGAEPATQASETAFRENFLRMVSRISSGNQDKDLWIKTVYRAALNFMESILKTNFFSPDKSALAFRLRPDFGQHYREVSAEYDKAFPSDQPWGVFFFFRRKAFGYQVRFAEISRGGWRTVIPQRGANQLEMNDSYDFARGEAYREVFVLAHTQHLKNKDIYEGGAKMLTLLEPLADASMMKPALWEAQRAFTAAFLSLVNYDDNRQLKDKAIVDRLGTREIIELGPDENMFDPMIAWIAEYAKKVGYTLGSGFISGKPGAGINHKEYGVTSYGVHQYLLKTLSELGIHPEKDDFSIKIAGGPGGDVAGNEMKLLLALDAEGKPVYPGLRLTAVTDGPAAAYDPDGLDHDELRRLLFKANLDSFDPEKLRGEGAMMVFSKPVRKGDDVFHRQVVRRQGKLEDNLISQNEFMLIFQHNLTSYADVLIPAGGRPSTINEGNWLDYFPDGKASFRAIVEGANSYITPGARNLIQQQGVWIVKDASANKCGVITSSYEIISGLLLSEEEFTAVKPVLVKQVKEILKKRAVQEADWLYSRFQETKTPMTELTEKLSREINSNNVAITEYLQAHPEYVTEELLLSHLPGVFRKNYPGRCHRLPEEYRIAIAAVELASRLVYATDKADLGFRLQMVMSEKEKDGIKI